MAARAIASVAKITSRTIRHRLSAVPPGELAAPEQRDPHGAEIGRGNAGLLGEDGRLTRVRRRLALDAEVAAAVRYQGDRAGSTGPLHPRQRFQTTDDFPEEGDLV